MSRAKKKNNVFLIRKENKDFERFNKDKLKRSLLHTGMSEAKSNEIIQELSPNIKDYFSTAQLHKATYKAILKRSNIYAANYDIKRAIYNLGPTGYPFEILCAEMLKAKGYKTKVSVLVKGEFVKHEVDVIAKRDDRSVFCECKFHNRKFYKNDIKIPLYVYARFLDIQKANPKEKFDYALISNTQFSEDAIKYSKGVGLILYSLNYPKKNTFCDIIRKYKVYPVTVLKTLKVGDRKKLLDEGIVVIKQLKKKHLDLLDIEENHKIKIMQEIKVLTRPN